jgi:hypothetical protein
VLVTGGEASAAASRASVKRQTGHASNGMPDRYDRGDPIADNSSARLGL